MKRLRNTKIYPWFKLLVLFALGISTQATCCEGDPSDNHPNEPDAGNPDTSNPDSSDPYTCENHYGFVIITGEIIYPDFKSGDTVIVWVCQDSDSECEDDGSISTLHPGPCVAEQSLKEPGKFSFDAEIHWLGDNHSRIDVLVWVAEDPDDYQSCYAGWLRTFDYGDHEDLIIEPLTGICPARE